MELMKKYLLTIITESAIEDELIEMIKINGASGYTASEVYGEGSRGVRKGDWDQNRNIKIEIICRNEIAEKIIDSICTNFFKDFAIVFYLKEILVLRDEKF